MDDQTLSNQPELKDGFRDAAPKLRFDPARSAQHLAEYDLTEAQKLSLMRVVWDFMVMVVDAGFEIDGVSLASDEAAQPDQDGTLPIQKDEPEERSP